MIIIESKHCGEINQLREIANCSSINRTYRGHIGEKKTKHSVTSDQEITINATRINLAIKLVSKMIIINRDHKSVNVNSRRRFDPARA